jgi:hypothetical protein
VTVENHLRAEGWVPTHFDGHVSPVWVQDMKGIMIHVRPGIFGHQLAEFIVNRTAILGNIKAHCSSV